MLADSDLIRLVSVLYGSGDPAVGASPLPAFGKTIATPLVRVGHILLDGVDYVIFPGSETPLDWCEDFDAVPVAMATLGLVHAGFMAAPLLVKGRLDALCGPRVVIGGHSLGAAHALDYGALRLVGGRPVERIVTFGCPMPGCAPMRDLLAPVPITNYRNLADPVPTAPEPIPLVFPCVQMRAFTALSGPPDPGDTGRFRFHHSWCYWRGLRALGR